MAKYKISIGQVTVYDSNGEIEGHKLFEVHVTASTADKAFKNFVGAIEKLANHRDLAELIK